MWRAVSRVLRSRRVVADDIRVVAGDILDTVFPGDCRVCGGPLSFVIGSGPLCSGCVGAIRPQRGGLCACCGEALGMESERFHAQGSEGVKCAECRLAAPAFTRAVAYGVYEDELREMIHLLKYEGVRSVVSALGRRLAETIAGLGLSDALVVAVPLFPAKQRARGYNQSVLLADAAVKRLRPSGLVVAHDVLRRVRDTESQFALTPRMRRKNLRGAFAVSDPAHVAGREVLLVDDIYTTGATARECARVLMAAGAAKVWVATLARAQKEQVGLWSGSVRDPVGFGEILRE